MKNPNSKITTYTVNITELEAVGLEDILSIMNKTMEYLTDREIARLSQGYAALKNIVDQLKK